MRRIFFMAAGGDLDDAGAVQVQFGAKWWQLILARTLKKVVYTSYPPNRDKTAWAENQGFEALAYAGALRAPVGMQESFRA